jgi:hypothetical protein
MLPEPDTDDAGAEVLMLLPEDAVGLITVPVPVAMPGKGLGTVRRNYRSRSGVRYYLGSYISANVEKAVYIR